MMLGFRFSSAGKRSGAGRACAVLAALAMFASPSARAGDGLDQLRQFVTRVDSARGQFEQTVERRSAAAGQQARGEFAFARPGRFHWRYKEPYRQELLGDGERLWTWDPDLNQVTVRRIDRALGATPAAILFGEADLEQSFELSDGGEENDLAWVDAVPRQAESGFEALRIGLADGEVRQMIIRDSFGQHTRIRFIELERNPQLSAGEFRFQPPPGADVIGDGADADDERP